MEKSIFDDEQQKVPKTEEEKIIFMKDALNQKYDIFSPELAYEMIEFGIQNHLPIGKFYHNC